MTLVRFEVELHDPEIDEWDTLGSVLLPDNALREQVEHALAAVGVYAPRGLDSIEWATNNIPYAEISDAGGECFVRLVGR